MLRSVHRLVVSPPFFVPRAHHKNWVWSEAMSILEQQCCQCWPPPRKSEQKVTVVGAASDIGRIVCLFLKQQRVVKILAMYDDVVDRKLMGVATDLAHIDTSTQVQAFQGRQFLPHALHNTDLVLICGGFHVMPPCCNIQDRELFFQNMQLVRTTTMACAKFCPHALLAVQSPPVDCNFALCKYTLKKLHCYDPRRLFGVDSISPMRANQIYSKYVKSDPSDSYVPVICGTSRCTRVPVFSNTKMFYCIPADKKDFLIRLVREGDDLVCRVKSNNEQAHLSIGFATARAVTNIMKGLHEKPTFIDGVLVEQSHPAQCYDFPICSTPVTVGSLGILKYEIPKLDDEEKAILENSRCDLEDMLNLGRCYAVGDEYEIHPDKIPPPPPKRVPCPVGGPLVIDEETLLAKADSKQ